MLNPNAKKWVEALRSGKYKQGKGILHNGVFDTYCCLGVACEIYFQENPALRDREMIGYNGAVIVLPEEVANWLGLSGMSGAYRSQSSLLQDNDTCGKSFAEIADIIESEPEGLFKETDEQVQTRP